MAQTIDCHPLNTVELGSGPVQSVWDLWWFLSGTGTGILQVRDFRLSLCSDCCISFFWVIPWHQNFIC